MSSSHFAKIAGFLLLACTIFVSCTGPHQERQSDVGLVGIINGTLESNEGIIAKHVAALRSKKNPQSIFCSSSIIDDHILLTAAHCAELVENLGTVEAVFDVDGTSKTAVAIEVEKILVYPKYHPVMPEAVCPIDGCESLSLEQNAGNTKEGDLALFLLKKSIPKGFSAITLNADKEGPSSFKTGTAAGYGFSDLEKKNPPYLRSMTSFLTYFSKSAKVLIDSTSGQSVCNGDSGGPLMAKQGSKYIQIGVASYSFDSAETLCQSKAMVYTSISDYADWIESGKLALPRQQEDISAPWLNLKHGVTLSEYTPSEILLKNIKHATMTCASKSTTLQADFEFYPYFVSEHHRIGLGKGQGAAKWSFDGKNYESSTRKNAPDEVRLDVTTLELDSLYWSLFWTDMNVDMAKVFAEGLNNQWVNMSAKSGDLRVSLNDDFDLDPDAGTFQVTKSAAESVELVSTNSQMNMTKLPSENGENVFNEKANCKLTIQFRR